MVNMHNKKQPGIVSLLLIITSCLLAGAANAGEDHVGIAKADIGNTKDNVIRYGVSVQALSPPPAGVSNPWDNKKFV